MEILALHPKSLYYGVMFMDVYLLDISPFLNSTTYEKYYDVCPQYRKNKINSLKNDMARMRSLGAEVLLAYGMNEYGISSYNIITTQSGKPFEENRTVEFNLSHSGKYVASAFSNSDIGIDIETPREVNLKLCDRFFSSSERDYVNGSKNKKHAFLRIWTRKEAFFKAIGVGITPLLPEICVLDDTVSFRGRKYTLATHCNDDYILSVAHDGDIGELVPKKITVS